MTYLFLGIKFKPFFRTFFAGHFLLIIVYFLMDIPLWVVPAVVFSGHLIYALTKLGMVQIKESEGKLRIVVKGLWRSVSLGTPLLAENWWNYMFESAEGSDAISVFGTADNDINVFLKLKDSANREVVFTEYIGFDTRFPNECRHSIETIAPGQVMFRIQRVDRLLEFLKKNLPAEALKIS